ncbi:MAG: hypothetical protein IKO26_11015 [Paludibacteraceae bacterium]|nr:hypothetical protein [Paludibacteraceae bacterium]
MKIILSQTCTYIIGAIAKTGYHLQRRKNGCFLKRNTKTPVPPGGHWQAIVYCAQIAQRHIWATDISIDWRELSRALYNAKAFVASEHVCYLANNKIKLLYNASDIFYLKHCFDL